MKHLLAVLTLGALPMASMAADTAPAPGPNTPNWLGQAKQAIEIKNYDLAIMVLNQSDAKKSADWHNLMGYSLRKKTDPDWTAAEKHYQSALEQDPKHRGALEYYGELLLNKNDLPGAEALLKRLEKACFFGCEELRDLQKSVADFKAKK
jgi:tetratricopeptide (TPR) repeat protein